MKKDIKSQTIDNTVKKYAVESATWKQDMRRAVNLGYKVEALNEEQTEYLKKCETDKAEKDLKRQVKAEVKQQILEKMSDEMKKKKASLLTVANDLADRIILKAIEVEERVKRFAKIDAKNKEKVKVDRMAKAEEKRKQKAELRNKTIPSLEAIAAAKSQQAFLAKAHAVKREEIEKRLDAKEAFMKQSAEEYEQKRLARIERDQKLLEAHRCSTVLKRTTKEQRIEAIKAKKAAGKAAFDAEMKRQASEIAADRKGYATRQEKRRLKESERLARIAKRRKERNDRIYAEKLKQQKISQANIARFIESEKIRLARKEENRAKYLTKGGIETPKVKNKVEVAEKHRVAAEAYIKAAEARLKEDKVRYIIRTAHIDAPAIVSDSVGAFVCKPEDLAKRMKSAHNKHMKEEPDTYVGIFAYSGVGNTQECVKEMINDKFLEYNGESTSRMKKETASKAA